MPRCADTGKTPEDLGLKIKTATMAKDENKNSDYRKNRFYRFNLEKLVTKQTDKSKQLQPSVRKH